MPKKPARQRDSFENSEPTVSYGTPRTSHGFSSVDVQPLNNYDTPKLPSGISSQVSSEPSLGEILQRTQNPGGGLESGPPRADSLAVLLEQGLKSSDISLLTTVLHRNDETIIRKTLEHLPVQYTIPLIQHLGKVCAEEKAKPNKAPLQWLSAVLTIRSSYLTTVPDLSQQLAQLYAHADRRTKYTDRFVRLAGVVNASVDLAKQRISQRAEAQMAEKKEILAYNEPLDDTSESDDENGNESDEDMGSDESDEKSSSESDEDGRPPKKTRKPPADTDSEDESKHLKKNPEVTDDESDED